MKIRGDKRYRWTIGDWMAYSLAAFLMVMLLMIICVAIGTAWDTEYGIATYDMADEEAALFGSEDETITIDDSMPPLFLLETSTKDPETNWPILIRYEEDYNSINSYDTFLEVLTEAGDPIFSIVGYSYLVTTSGEVNTVTMIINPHGHDVNIRETEEQP